MPLERNPNHLSLNDMIEKGYSLLKALTTMEAQDLEWQAEDPKNRCVFTLTTNLEHWLKDGIMTASDLANYLDNC